LVDGLRTVDTIFIDEIHANLEEFILHLRVIQKIIGSPILGITFLGDRGAHEILFDFLDVHDSILTSFHGVLHRGEKIIFSNELLFSTGEQHHEEPSIHGVSLGFLGDYPECVFHPQRI
jgi:hypothetical protein